MPTLLIKKLKHLGLASECHVTFSNGNWVRGTVHVLLKDEDVLKYGNEYVKSKFSCTTNEGRYHEITCSKERTEIIYC